MKTTWQTKSLGEIIIEHDKSLLRSKGNINGDYPFFVSGYKIKCINKYLVDGKNIFLPTGGNFFVHYFDGKAAYSTDTWCINTVDNVSIEYVYYFLFANQVFISKELFKGAALKHLQKKDFRKLKIPTPPLPEQKRIVSILDKSFDAIDKAIENTEKNIENCDKLYLSKLQLIFKTIDKNSERFTLRECSIDFGRGKSKHRPRNDKKLYGGNYPFVQTGDVRNCDHIVENYSQTYNEVGLSQSKLWPKGTICITIAANIAETGILNFDACFPDSIIGIVVNPNITSNNYVEYLLQYLKVYIQSKGKGSAQDNINLATFENEKFPFPSLKKQQEIIDDLKNFSSFTKSIKSTYQKKISSLKELKQSLLAKAFRGEL